MAGSLGGDFEPRWFTDVREKCISSLNNSSDILRLNLYVLKHYATEIEAFIVSQTNDFFVDDLDDDKCGQNSLLIFSRPVWTIFQQLQWTSLFRKAFVKSLCGVIASKTKQICDESVEEERLPVLQNWYDSNILPFLTRLSLDKDSDSYQEELSVDLRRYIDECFVQERAQIIFDIIRDYPESSTALLELRQCLCNSPSHRIAMVGHRLRKELTRRLLHIAIATPQILDFYMQMIKVLRLLDSSDLLLTFAAQPVREYLQSRRDAIRCIIAQLTDRTGELQSELRKGGQSLATLTAMNDYDNNDDEDDNDAKTWQPLPKIKDLQLPTTQQKPHDNNAETQQKQQAQQQQRGLDILATLVSIYPSPDLFMSEYRSLLSERLLLVQKQPHINMAQQLLPELRMNIELLKLRFGEDALQYCEIMLRDVEESRRVQTAIVNDISSSSTENNHFPVEMLIVSEHYWPAQQIQLPSPNDDYAMDTTTSDQDNNNATGVRHPPTIQQQLDKYFASYHNLKKPRKLFPLSQHGAVEVELTFDDGVCRSFLCSPIHADVIMLLQTDDNDHQHSEERQYYTASLIAKQLNVSEEEAHAALLFWKTRRVLISHPTIPGAFIIDEQQAQWAAEDANSANRRHVRDDLEGDNDDDDHEENANIDELSFSFEEAPNHTLDTASIATNNEARRKRASQYATSFITGLLRSHGGMALDRLQPLLAVTLRAALEADPEGLTSTDLNFAWSKASLMQFLQVLVEQGTVDCVSGVYSVATTSSSNAAASSSSSRRV